MAFRDGPKLLNIYEARNARKQLEQRNDCEGQFAALDRAIALLPQSQDRGGLQLPYLPFNSIARTDRSPAWNEVDSLLEGIAGPKRIAGPEQTDSKAIVIGADGIELVRKVIGRAIVGGEFDVYKARYWLDILKDCVDHTRIHILAQHDEATTSPPSDNGASSGLQQQPSVSNDSRNPSVPANSPSPVDSGSKYRLSNDATDGGDSSDLSGLSRSQSLSVNSNPDTGFDYLTHLNRELSVQPSLSPRSTVQQKRMRGDSPSPSPTSEDKPRRSTSPRKADTGKLRATEPENNDGVEGTVPNGEAEQEARDEPTQAKKRKTRSFAATYAEDTDTENEGRDGEEAAGNEEEEGAEKDSASDFQVSEGEDVHSEEETVRPRRSRVSSGAQRIVVDDEEDDEADEQQAQIDKDRSEQHVDIPKYASTDDNGGGLRVASPRIQSSEEQLVRSIFPSLPAGVDLAYPSHFSPSQAQLATAFKRAEIGGKQQSMINAGTADGLYYKARNHLCMQADMNICSTPNGTRLRNPSFPAGQPMVVIGRESKLKAILKSIDAIPRLGKSRPFINVWIGEPKGWFYKGLYEVAYEGIKSGKVEYLAEPTGNGLQGGIHPELVEKIRAHATQNSKERSKGSMERVHEVLESWDFEARNLSEVDDELETMNTAGRRRHVKYIALRCIGWDEESWDEWIAKRNGLR